MSAFADPFQKSVNRKLNKEEPIQALRSGIVGELEAIYLYDVRVQAADIEIAKRVFAGIRDEKEAYIGELMTLLHTLDPQEAELFTSGEAEVRRALSELGITVPEDKSSSNFSAPVTVGSLLDKF